ncbi:phage/plasmid primase, P4 family [Mycolicibacter heraklionensis]|nr:phage/plasmid primase, P4 family [Mycolicibacter heraklionensis]
MAYRLAEAYADKLLHVHALGWHTWDGARWVLDTRGAASRAVLEVLRTALVDSVGDDGDRSLRTDVRKCESHNGIQGVLGVAAALEQFAATVQDLDADPYLLNLANGTLDLRTLTLAPHDPRDRITKVARAAHHDAPGDATWRGHIERVIPADDVRSYLQRLAGVALLGRVTEHILPILTGTGANGKSVTYKAFCHALGDYASTAEPDLFMHREGAHPTGEADLMGRRLIVVSESERDRRLAEATMKRLTGGDTIRARRMRQDFFEFEPAHLPLLITNHLPKVSGDDPAIWRRIRVIPFGVEIPPAERDPHLDERLQAEADGVLAWMLAGWADYRQRGGLDEPPSVMAATDAYQLASDAVGRFIAECCNTSPAVKATTSQLFDAWDRWRAADGAEPLSLKAFGQALDLKGYAVHRSNGKKWRLGIALKPEDGDGHDAD